MKSLFHKVINKHAPIAERSSEDEIYFGIKERKKLILGREHYFTIAKNVETAYNMLNVLYYSDTYQSMKYRIAKER